MRKYLLSILILFSTQVFAQTFKITKVETSKDYRYQEMNKRLLNKNITATFNDNTVTISPIGTNDPITLKKVSDYAYSFSVVRGSVREYFDVTFNRTFGVISSFEFIYIKKNGGEDEKSIFTAKRF